ncbi:MAG: hypothetical protein J5501_04340 [Ruminococcus sp.]|nr:hypothetical protein [Ruminococcus sp.]
MEFIGEFIMEMLSEGASEAIGCKRIPKYIRYPLAIIVMTFVAAVIGIIFTIGVAMLSTNTICGTLLAVFGAVMAALAARHFSGELRALRNERPEAASGTVTE